MVHLSEYETFLNQHQNQLISSGVPQHFWETLYKKISTQTFDSGNTFNLTRIDYEGAEKSEYDPSYQIQIKVEDGIKSCDSSHIYLIDHAWTYRVEFAKKQLLSNEYLRERMAGITGVHDDNVTILCDKIFDEMWRYANTYSVGNAESIEDRMPVWYIMDEVGSAVRHSDVPNFRMVPFIHIPENMTYSLIFPVQDLEFAEVVTRDYAEGIVGEERKAFLLPWVPNSMIDCSYEHVDPSPDYFLGGHIKETLPILEKLEARIDRVEKLNVYTQYDYIRKYLTNPMFNIVDDEDGADVLWYTQHFKKFEELSATPHKFVNQFPFEYILTIKDLLSITCRRKSAKQSQNFETSPRWLPTTYNLRTEIVQFVSYFQNRNKAGLDNHWIIKPFNLARGLDTHITANLNYIMRLPATGSKIAQKYIENPVLFDREECGRVKFDIRYVVLLKSAKPLQVFAYKNFFLRFANMPFELNNFDEYQKHFTVMNYSETASLKHMLCSEFKSKWECQYPNHAWVDVEEKILEMLREVFECATLEPPPCGISESPQSRALYAADIMLEWNKDDMQPKLLEINWTPDCQRACEYYPDFYNHIFLLLFGNVENEDVFHKL